MGDAVSDRDLECPICHIVMVLRTAVPGCGHVFCFLCIKGACVTNMIRDCPMCRGPIYMSMFNHPSDSGLQLQMSDPEVKDAAGSSSSVTVKTEDDDIVDGLGSVPVKAKFFWLYSGRHGWWRFDPRHESDIEEAMLAGMPLVELSVCGATYIVDFQNMVQYNKNHGIKAKRDVRRASENEFASLNVRGIAGVTT